MAKTLEFFFDFVSPTSYLAYTQLEGVKERTGCDIEFVPMFLGGVMQATGNRPPGTVPEKGRYMGEDMARFCKKYGIPFQFNPNFPMNTLIVLRGLVAHEGNPEAFSKFVETAFHHSWVEPKNLGERTVVKEILDNAGLDGDGFIAASAQDENKEKVKANTARALSKGVFGAPTFFVGEHMFFGQDRFEFIEDALTRGMWV